jgi:hypothetical protein
VALATDVGVPESKPVDVLKVSPAGAAGDMEYEATVPPPEGSIVYPVITLFTVFVSATDEIVNAGAASGGAAAGAASAGAAAGAAGATGTAVVLISGVIRDRGEVPSIFTAAI